MSNGVQCSAMVCWWCWENVRWEALSIARDHAKLKSNTHPWAIKPCSYPWLSVVPRRSDGRDDHQEPSRKRRKKMIFASISDQTSHWLHWLVTNIVKDVFLFCNFYMVMLSCKDSGRNRQCWGPWSCRAYWVWNDLSTSCCKLRKWFCGGWLDKGAFLHWKPKNGAWICIIKFPRSVQVSASNLKGSRERDFFRWVNVSSSLQTYRAKLPLLTDASTSATPDCIMDTEVSVVLPSDMVRGMHKAGPEVLGLAFFHTRLSGWFCLYFLMRWWRHVLDPPKNLHISGEPLDEWS